MANLARSPRTTDDKPPVAGPGCPTAGRELGGREARDLGGTGHPLRLGRKHKCKVFEERPGAELVTEISSVFVCAQLGISLEPRDENAAYVANWLSALKNGTRCIFTAAGAAQYAVAYLDGLQLQSVPPATRPVYGPASASAPGP